MILKKILLIILLWFVQTITAQNILGIDVSHHQGSINWTLVANDGKVFAYCKATEGMTYQDPNFQIYIANGHNAGVVMGAYHFARPDNNTAIDDANNFINQAHNYIGAGYLPPVLDLEDPNSSTHLDQLFTSSALTNWVQTWLNRIESQTGVRPIIYTNSNLANYLNSSINNYGLWIAKPGTSPTTPPNDIGVWNDWLFKQYSWTGNVNGISGDVDLNVFHGTAGDFDTVTNYINSYHLGFKIYPNPVQDYLHIELLKPVNITAIGIYDIHGRLIKKIEPENLTQINMTDLETGFYFLIIEISPSQSYTFKLVKN